MTKQRKTTTNASRVSKPRRADAPEPEVRVELMSISDLQRAPRNPKKHALEDLDRSFARFGFVAPLILNEGTGTIVAGHGRLDALVARWESGDDPPSRIVARDGEWFVPVIRGVSFASDAEAEAYLLADNRLVELGGWNSEGLAEMLEAQAAESVDRLAGLGWDTSEVAGMLKRYRPESPVLEQITEPVDPIDLDDEGGAESEEPKVIYCPKCGHGFSHEG